jgi:hypothetical protein
VTDAIEWRGRYDNKGYGGKRRASVAHLFVNGVGYCYASRFPVGEPSPYQARPTRELTPVECSPAGRPYAAQICAHCETEWERRNRERAHQRLETKLEAIFGKPVTLVR